MEGQIKRIDHQGLEDIDRTIHSPTRLKIMIVLTAVEEADFTFISRVANLTRGNLSANLRKLEKVGYVIIKKGFNDRVPQTIVELTKKGKKSLLNYSQVMGSILDDLREILG